MSQAGKIGIGTTDPQSALHISSGAVMASDPNYNAINVRLDGTSIPAIRFTRWTGGGTSNHNAFVGQFMNTSASNEYSLGFGTGISPTGDQNATTTAMTILQNGNVGIGTIIPDAKLAVSGQVHAQEVKVSVTVPGPDYVFEKGYALPTLEQIKTYIDANKHLPEVPSAKEMEKNGVQLGEMNMILLKKVEELTLYLIEVKRENEELRARVEAIETKK
jgi:hypothetical protein